MTTTPVLSQSHFRWRTDSATVETAPTWGAAIDTNWTQVIDTNFRVRFTIQETAGGNPAAHTVKLQYNKNGGAFNDVTTSSSNVKAVDASSSADEAATTTQRLTGTGAYKAGVYSEDGSTTTSVDLAASNNTEYEFGLAFVTADVADGDTITLKVVALSGTAITATVIPSLTVETAHVGTLAATLGDLTLAATGALPIVGTSAVTLGAATLVATGTLPIVGSLSGTLGAATLVATGEVTGGSAAGLPPNPGFMVNIGRTMGLAA